MRELPRVGILHYTAPPVVGGVETVIAEHVRLLTEAGIPTRLIVGRGGESVPTPGAEVERIPLLDSENPDNLAVGHDLELGVVPEQFGGLCDQLRRTLQQTLQDIDVLVVHNILTMHFNLPLTVALHQLLDTGEAPKIIAWSHDASWNDPLQVPRLHPRHPWTLLRRHRSDVRYVVLTRERQVELARMFRCPQKSLRVIPNGIHVRFWWGLSPQGDSLVSQLGLLDRDLVLLQPTRITHLKNLTMSLQIAAALKGQGVNFRLIVTGPPDPHDPEGRALLEQLLDHRRQLNLEEEVVFLCLLEAEPESPRTYPRETVRDLYMASDLVLLPSTSEGFGIPVIEAGMIGRPVFCADIPPFREIGRDLTHRFRLDEEPEAVAKRILAWAERDLGHRLRRRVRQRFTWRRILQDHLLPLLLEVHRLPPQPEAG